jgi:DNA-binding IclR family transcriptional regulator
MVNTMFRLAILDGSDNVYVERCRSARQGQRDVDLNLHVGSRLPAYCTSMGKVLLAYSMADLVEQFGPALKRTAADIATRAGYRSE